MGRKLGFAIVLTLIALASFAIVYDRLDRSPAENVDFVNPPTAYATTSLPPHPATAASHPQSP